VTDPDQPDAENQQFGLLIVMMLAVLLIAGLIAILVQVIGDLVAECKSRSNQSREAQAKEDEDTRYKKWKKRRQLVKRENALKEKQKLLD
jgi:cell shape-determining protein MreC